MDVTEVEEMGSNGERLKVNTEDVEMVDVVDNESSDDTVCGTVGGMNGDRVCGLNVDSVDSLHDSGGMSGSIAEDVVVLETLGSDGGLIVRMLNSVGGTGNNREATPPKATPIPVPPPTVGMEFTSGIEFVAYMHRYGHSVGFGVRIRGSEKDQKRRKDEEDIDWKLVQWFNLQNKYQHSWKIRTVCRKEGYLKSKSKDPSRSTQTCKTGCRYVVNACRTPRKGTTWRITEVKAIHNHGMNPLLIRHLPRYRRICIEDARIGTELHKAGVGMGNMYDVFVNKYKSYEAVPFTEQDLRNYIYYMERKPMKNTDFAGMEVHFKKMRELSPNFFYEYDVDEDKNLKNVFWADSRCRQAFEEFGDVVSFDTTFVSNRYKMPFAPFIGVNHHGKTMLFGCALIGKEDTASFEWLFRVWKQCMGKVPSCILTDQDKAIGCAVASEFPGISHRWCIWHVKRNFRKHHCMLPDYIEISEKLEGILHDSFSIEEFESRWEAWVSYYQLGSSRWVNDMYRDRSRWVPVYFKGNFWAGMSSTQRSEGMNHYLKTFVNINTCLTKFVAKYAKAVCKMIAAEGRDDLIGADRCSRQTTTHIFESIFEKMYTREKFLKFHDELVEMNHNIATIKQVVNESLVVYDVLVKTFRVGWTRKEHFDVSIQRDTLEVKCECKNFEFNGILCAHMLRVFWMEDITVVPERYLLRRWRKDVPRKYLSDSYPAAALLGTVQIEAIRYEEVHRVAQQICVMVMNNEALQKEALESLTSMKNLIEERVGNPEGVTSYVVGGVGKVYRCLGKGRQGANEEREKFVGEDVDASAVNDPVDKRGRGRGQTKRKRSFLDKNGGGTRGGKRGRRANNCGSTLPNTPVKDVQMNVSKKQWQGDYVPQFTNRLRHGFKVTGSSANIPL